MDIMLRDLNRDLQQIRQYLHEGGRLTPEERQMLTATLYLLLRELDLHRNGGDPRHKTH